MKWWWLFRRRSPKQTTWIYCPGCGRELIGHGDWIQTVYWRGVLNITWPGVEGAEKFCCGRCGGVSYWDFDAPAPLFLEFLPGVTD